MSEHTCPTGRSDDQPSRLEEIRRILMTEHSESRLALQLTAHLEALRGAFGADRTKFSSSDIDFLKSARDILAAVESFRAVAEETQYIENEQDYQDCRRRLTEIRSTVGDIAVRKRVDRELRALAGRRPELEARFEDAAARPRLTVEREAPTCTCGAPMVLRTSEYGEFWGCSSFPVCWHRRPLCAKHERILREG